MKLTPDIQKAIDKSAKLHNKQMRRSGQLPYIVHPYSVGAILSNYTDDEDIIIAGFMHDVLEDVEGYNVSNLREDFGNKVTNIVLYITEDKKPSDSQATARKTWKHRKTKYIHVLKNTTNQNILLVACADKVHNLQAFLEVYEEEGEDMWKNFNAPEPRSTSTMWFHDELLKVFKKNLKSNIVDEYEELVAIAMEKFGE
ncbi:bifunctional (p)ppGpp synthetase/guanosine-3',5'-bis(diphosphate) 3'-pyrophosphohydrolase [bacterium]|jgi:(p)ppGpp synthase/HD superfamily hydrolase|nr:bifunctional (p)ppGpp synthetase/guanosine-3',5'-bis(diphosphate) 3'-pyrophosphohydrolase [bacterium]MBT4250755.1 bifunctional (p)ppGpp synthetase/guanosine-3',5'-bis(diphosphate) 3'-pyrophosphohydrolase [bacterium]MBT4598162.1 bifunctional (p)ppGpp synthetase/guanosine-3',5'-bis(diphosphate) 3'-pyrophosphohydrolase [bacterium]MBT6753760.1 bifunctional (p)ppGpp synthetase/guanosine-3',5'-bis(diphosphate) 3'-pyrophosphohydrolase [bacterium]MBT7037527.1 bifunctional (p)ppGpp synthetase/guanosi